MKRIDLVLCSILAVIAIVAICLIGGCAHHAAPIADSIPATQPALLPHPGQTPPQLADLVTPLRVFILLAVLGVGVGVGLFFWLPAAHNLSLGIAFISGGVEVSALVTRASLWFIPYLVYGLLAAAVGFLVYEVVRNFEAVEADSTGVYASVKSFVTAAYTKVTGLFSKAPAKLVPGTPATPTTHA